MVMQSSTQLDVLFDMYEAPGSTQRRWEEKREGG
jgi:hypothetical protein